MPFATPTQRRHLTEEIDLTNAKRARAAAYNVAPRTSGLAARNAAAAGRDGSHALEGRILAAQGY